MCRCQFGYLIIPFPFPLINEKRPKNSSFFPSISKRGRTGGRKITESFKKARTRKKVSLFFLPSRINLRNFGGQLFPLIKGIFFSKQVLFFLPGSSRYYCAIFFLWKTTIALRGREEHQNGAHLHAPYAPLPQSLGRQLCLAKLLMVMWEQAGLLFCAKIRKQAS